MEKLRVLPGPRDDFIHITGVRSDPAKIFVVTAAIITATTKIEALSNLVIVITSLSPSGVCLRPFYGYSIR